MKRALLHLLVCLAVAAMVAFGFWQLDRLDAKKKLNQEIQSRVDSPLLPVEAIVSHLDPWSIGDSIKFRKVFSEGEYQDEDSVLIRNRSLNGSPGYWLLTPLLLGEGIAVVVNRGWLPISAKDYSPEPIGEVYVSGLIRETKKASGLQRDDPSGEILESLARPNLERYQEQLGYKILPIYIQLEYQDPAQVVSEVPVLLKVPSFDEGPHRNYAIQWFLFATVFAVGYPLILRRIGRKNDRGEGQSDIPIDYL
jgi:cytochrome oxidase assembly protein ShyY1